MATLPLKSSRNEQRAVICLFVGKRRLEHLGLEVLPHPPYGPGLAPVTVLCLGQWRQCARWAERHIRYWGAIRRSSVAWTAASIALCIGHSV